MNTKEMLQAHLKALQEEKAGLLAKTVDLKAEREKFIVAANEANAKVNELTERIHAIERPAGERGVIQVLEEIASVAKALGGLQLNG